MVTLCWCHCLSLGHFAIRERSRVGLAARHTLSRTLPKAFSSSSTCDFSAIRSMRDTFPCGDPFAALWSVEGPEGTTVGLCILFIGKPIITPKVARWRGQEFVAAKQCQRKVSHNTDGRLVVASGGLIPHPYPTHNRVQFANFCFPPSLGRRSHLPVHKRCLLTIRVAWDTCLVLNEYDSYEWRFECRTFAYA